MLFMPNNIHAQRKSYIGRSRRPTKCCLSGLQGSTPTHVSFEQAEFHPIQYKLHASHAAISVNIVCTSTYVHAVVSPFLVTPKTILSAHVDQLNNSSCKYSICCISPNTRLESFSGQFLAVTEARDFWGSVESPENHCIQRFDTYLCSHRVRRATTGHPKTSAPMCNVY